ncbi:hypothetical protein [Acinetobacter piscicola]|uniref:hypothetical protein n=1 Tax=Acinetobacter piscicola TaxID=2006115 RepID=UPI001022218B|nr:hypothetical protein [Acinetobacter piscicola]RYL29666.1 hypothetical protein EWP19_02485 [Acinetobacter piscicola]
MTQESLDFEDPNSLIISLKHILNKLFTDEDLKTAEHIQYVANLLSSVNTEGYLTGLQLEQIDFDIQFQDEFSLEIIAPTRKRKVSDTPIVWYVNSIAQLNDSHHKAMIWNVLSIKAAIYLMALPALRPDLFKEAYTEHFNTVKRLFHRMRNANKVLSHSRKHQNTDNYLKLFAEYLPEPTLSLEDLVTYLESLTDSDQLDEFDQHLINDIRIPFNYVLQNKAKIARANVQRQIQTRYLDEDQLIEETVDLVTVSKSKALNLENQLDEPEARVISTNPSHISPIANYSTSSQNYFHLVIAKHIQRKEHLLTSSSLYPNPSSIQYLLKELYQGFLRGEKESLILLLMFLTGNSADHWIKAQSRRVKNLTTRQTLIYKNQQYYLSTKFTIFENKEFPFKGLLNDTIYFDLPIANELIDGLRAGEKIEIEAIYKKINLLKNKLFIPKLSLLKTNSLLHHRIYELTGDQQLANILLGIDANQASSISYCHHNIFKIQQKYISIIQQLNQDLGKRYTEIHLDSSLNFGSRKAPRAHIIQNIFNVLATKIYQCAAEDWIGKFNHYSIWMWNILLLFTSARPVADFPGFLKNFNLKRKIFYVSDKEVGGRQGDGRIIPLCDFLVQEVQNFVCFLNNIKHYFGKNEMQMGQHIQDILDSKKPLLSLCIDGVWKSLSPAIVKNFHLELGLNHANWHRHTARAFLTDKISEPEILALFGHEQMQQEAAHPFSSLSFSQYSKIADVLQQMKAAFQIPEINIDVIL